MFLIYIKIQRVELLTLINNKNERIRVFELGKKYAKLFLTYQTSKEQTE